MSQPSKTSFIKANRKTAAAKYNVQVLRGLEKILLNDPEADITNAIPSQYTERLQLLRHTELFSNNQPTLAYPNNDVRSRLDSNDTANIIFPLTSEVEKIITKGNDCLVKGLLDLLDDSEVLYESAWAASVMVFRIDEGIVTKVGHEDYAKTEHQTLSFLQEHLPDFPAPKPHGLMRLGAHCFLFTSYIPGVTLEEAWPGLSHLQKQDISQQIDDLLSKLRAFPVPKAMPLGGVYGWYCKDLSQEQWVDYAPATSDKFFRSSIFASSNTATSLYAKIIRQLVPVSTKVVLTHGDIRPANIIIRRRDDDTWDVAAIIDWESGGFYPEYWESVKATNLLTPRVQFDWYNYLPQSVSPSRFPIHWLADKLLGRCVVNN